MGSLCSVEAKGQAHTRREKETRPHSTRAERREWDDRRRQTFLFLLTTTFCLILILSLFSFLFLALFSFFLFSLSSPFAPVPLDSLLSTNCSLVYLSVEIAEIAVCLAPKYHHQPAVEWRNRLFCGPSLSCSFSFFFFTIPPVLLLASSVQWQNLFCFGHFELLQGRLVTALLSKHHEVIRKMCAWRCFEAWILSRYHLFESAKSLDKISRLNQWTSLKEIKGMRKCDVIRFCFLFTIHSFFSISYLFFFTIIVVSAGFLSLPEEIQRKQQW